MAAPDRQGQSKYARTKQDIANSGFDEAFQVPTIELLAYNADNNPETLDRVQINSSGQLLTSGVLTDGTTPVSIVPGDPGYNGIATIGGTSTYQFSTNTPGAQVLLADTLVKGYTYVTVIATSVGSGLAWGGQFSPSSGGNYVTTTQWQNNNSFGQSGAALGTSVNTFYVHSAVGNYFRLNVTALSSGTLSGYVILSNNPHPTTTIAATQVGTWSVGSNSATGSATPTNAFFQGLQARNTSPTAATNGNLVGAVGDLFGVAQVSSGGLLTTTVAAGIATNTVVKASAGRLCRVLVTATGTNAMSIYDNATTNSGTIIGALPASPAVGSVYDFNLPSANGITVGGNASNPAVTISYI